MSVWPFKSRAGGGSVSLLVDIGGTSAAMAILVHKAGIVPLICYAKRVPITAHESEAPEAALTRALTVLLGDLGTEGVTALRGASGLSAFDEAVVAIDAPWQQTIVRIEEKRSDTPFTFTKRTLAEILRTAEAAVTAGGDRKVEQRVVGVRLNGYPTANPVGRSARRAALIILVSSMHEAAVEAIRTLLREKLRVVPAFTSGVTLRYQVLRQTFPHERDLLILDAAGHAAALALVRARSLVAIREFPSGRDEQEWVAAVQKALGDIATSYPLPRTVLLVADEKEARAQAAALQAGGLQQLWVTEEPPKIVPVSRIPGGSVALAHGALPDIRLILMAEHALTNAAPPYAQ